MRRAMLLPGDTPRSVSIRYFGFYRLVIASLLSLFSIVGGVGDASSHLYTALMLGYWLTAVGFLLMTPKTREQFNAMLMGQVAFDVLVLTSGMYIGGAQSSSVPYLLMTTLAGAALVGEGRMVLGFAAMTTLAVLAELLVRILLRGVQTEELTRTGVICMGYFAVALLTRMLARRALEHEALARQRGAALQRQTEINARIIADLLDGVVVLDSAGRVRMCNPRAAEFLGCSLVEGEHIAHRAAELDAALRLQQSRVRVERSGKTLHLRRMMTGDEGDQLIYLEDFARIESQARQIKLAALGRLTANIAHEIRNPLASITQAAELLVDEKRAQMQQRLSRIVQDNAARIARIVSDVLEVGRRDRTVPELLDARAFVTHFLEEFALHSPAVSACVVLSVSGAPQLRFDRMHLAQILGNLLGNALRYCRRQPGSVEISIAALDAERVSLCIRDDGPGIPAAQREQVFEPFHTTDPKGTGLGLYVARELADANAARLVLLDSEGGAAFQLIARSME